MPVGKSLSVLDAKEGGKGGGEVEGGGATGGGQHSARVAKSPEFRSRVKVSDIFHTNNKQTNNQFLTHSIFLKISQIHSNIHNTYIHVTS